MKIRPEAGKLRGVRIMEDPKGLLMDTFMDMNGQTQYGYLILAAEGSPAVYDGLDWHPICDDMDASEMLSLADRQMEAIKAVALDSPEYAKMLSIFSVVH
jgi:hypothetical protein